VGCLEEKHDGRGRRMRLIGNDWHCAMRFGDCDLRENRYGSALLLFQHERATSPVPRFVIELRCGLRITPEIIQS
jgi:hypothetical protein